MAIIDTTSHSFDWMSSAISATLLATPSSKIYAFSLLIRPGDYLDCVVSEFGAVAGIADVGLWPLNRPLRTSNPLGGPTNGTRDTLLGSSASASLGPLGANANERVFFAGAGFYVFLIERDAAIGNPKVRIQGHIWRP